jgi:hypothetical protein
MGVAIAAIVSSSYIKTAVILATSKFKAITNGLALSESNRQ